MQGSRAGARVLFLAASVLLAAIASVGPWAIAEESSGEIAPARGLTRVTGPIRSREEAMRRAREADTKAIARLRAGDAAVAQAPALASAESPPPTFTTSPKGALSLEAGHVRLEVDPAGAVRCAPLGAAVDGPLGLRFSLESWGRAGAPAPLPPPGAPSLESASVAVIPRGASLSEVYEPRPLGVEQLFRIAAAPEGTGDLVLRARLSGGLAPSQAAPDAPIALADDRGLPQLSYGLAVAVDARGARAACGLALEEGGALTITVPGAWLDAAARPIVIDPLIGTSQLLSRAATRERQADAAYSIASDRLIVVWEQEIAPTNRGVFMTRYAPTGTATPNPEPIDLSPVALTATGDCVLPAVAWLGGGVDRYLVAWVDLTTLSVRGAIVDPLGSGPGAVTPLPAPIVAAPFSNGPDTYGAVSDVVVAGRLDGAGWLVAVEARFFNGTFLEDTDILTFVVSAQGGIGPVNLAGSTSFGGSFLDDRLPAVNRLAATGGGWALSWESVFSPSDSDVLVSLVDVTGAAGARYTGFAETSASEERPSVDGPGPDYVVTYELRDTASGDRDLVMQRLDSLFATGPMTLSVSASVDARASSVAYAGSEYLVGWIESASAAGPTGTGRLARLEGGALAVRELGTAFGTAGRVTDIASIARRGAAVAGKPDYLLAWSELVSGSLATGEVDLAIQRAEGSADPVFVLRQSTAAGEIVGDNASATGRREFFRQSPGAGVSAPSVFFIENRGGIALDVASVTLTNAVDFAVRTPALPFAVPPGGAVSVTATFAPVATGVTTGAVTIGWGGGSLAGQSFRLNVRGEGVSRTASATSATITAIPDATTVVGTVPGVTTSAIVIADPGVVVAIRVINTTIRHASVQDLDLVLISPAGTRVLLAQAVGGSGADFVDTTFSDAAGNAISSGVPPFSGIFAPEERLDALVGEVGTGAWTLEMRDFTPGDAGTLEGWGLELVLTIDPILEVLEGPAALGAAIPSGAPAAGGRDLGAQALGAAAPASVTITVVNAGFDPLSLTAGPSSSAADFTVVTGAALTGIAQGASASFTIVFTPTLPGAKSGQISFATNDPAAPGAFVVNVRGFAFDPATAASLTLPAVSLLPLEVPDADPAGISSTIRCPGRGQVISVAVTGLTIRHSFVSDLTVTLTGPSGAFAVLCDGQGGSEDDIEGATFSDAAASILTGVGPFTGAFLPLDPLTVFGGAAAEGDWTLEVADAFQLDDGILLGWTLEVRTTEAPLEPYIVVRRGSASGPVLVSRAGGPAELNMGVEVLGAAAPRTETIVVTNAGGGTLSVSAPTFTAGAVAGEYVLAGGVLSLGAGASGTYALALAPSTEGVHDVTLAAAHSAVTATANPYSIRVRGTGAGSLVRASGAGPFPLSIPDGTGASVTSTASVVASGAVVCVTLTATISHGEVEDLTLALSHAGVAVTLVDRENGNGEDLDGTTFDDGARISISLAGSPFRGAFRPAGGASLAAFAGLPAAGDWALTVTDAATGDAGTLDAWSVEVGVVAAPLLDAREGSAAGAVLVSDAAPSGGFAFGDQPSLGGAPARATVFIANAGNAPLDLSGLAIAGAASFSLDPPALGVGTLAGGRSTTFSAVFDPSLVPANLVNSVVTATARFAHTDTGRTSPFFVRVSGRAVRGVLEVLEGATPLASGATLTFPAQDIGSGPTAARTITLRNAGLASLVVQAPVLGGNAAEFTSDAGGAVFPASIPAGATLTVLVRFDPATGGARAATLSIAHDGAGAASPFLLSLAGTGTVTTLSLRPGSGGGGGGGGFGCHARGGGEGRGRPEATIPALLATLIAVKVFTRRRTSARP